MLNHLLELCGPARRADAPLTRVARAFARVLTSVDQVDGTVPVYLIFSGNCFRPAHIEIVSNLWKNER